jgi:phage gpG-like protein
MISIEIVGAAELTERLEAMSAGMVSLPIQEALKVLAAGVAEQFDEGGDPEWAPKKDGSPATLIESGDMRAAATATRAGVDGSVYNLAPDAGQIGVADLFHGARRHTFGYGGPDSLGRHFDEPGRAFLVIREEDRAKVVEVVDVWLSRLMEAS